MTHARYPRLLALAAPVVFGALLVAACGGEKQMAVQAPVAPPAETMGQTSMQKPEVPNTPTATNISISAEVAAACNIPDRDAYFAFDSSNVTAFDRAPLDAVAKCFATGPLKGRKVDLVGHADPRGSAGYNMTLGQARADAVAAYISTRGVKTYDVTPTSRGALDATGRDETGWAHDRRVDVKLAGSDNP